MYAGPTEQPDHQRAPLAESVGDAATIAIILATSILYNGFEIGADKMSRGADVLRRWGSALMSDFEDPNSRTDG